MSSQPRESDLRLAALKSDGTVGALLRLFGPLADRILQLRKLNRYYHRYGLAGLSGEEFVERVVRLLRVQWDCDVQELQRIPPAGRAIVVANHPIGGLEGILLCKLLLGVRRDFKILANLALGLIAEMRPFLILTNPLKTRNPRNVRSLRLAVQWLHREGLLVLFPAGKVAYYRSHLHMITDGHWNTIPARIARMTQAPVIPIHFTGSNSRLFYVMSRVFYRFRLLMLPREFLRSRSVPVHIGVRVGNAIPPAVYSRYHQPRRIASYLRMRTYLLAPVPSSPVPPVDTSAWEAVVPAVAPEELAAEIDALPREQLLHSYRQFDVYWAEYEQIPAVVREIGRLREVTYRELQEGSGRSCDTDRFDHTYTHLFIWDREEREVIGSYRMGRSDRLLAAGDPTALRLSELFHYTPESLARVTPGLEMGRSFIVAKHQRTHYGLFLLWRGIGEFLLRFPRYRYLFGTVSLSTVYRPVSLSLMARALVGERMDPVPKHPFHPALHPEVEHYLRRYGLDLAELSEVIKSLEPEGFDIPVLVKQYAKLGARFTSVALDVNFLDTPGVFLSVDIPAAPPRAMKLYMGDRYPEYLAHYGPTCGGS